MSVPVTNFMDEIRGITAQVTAHVRWREHNWSFIRQGFDHINDSRFSDIYLCFV